MIYIKDETVNKTIHNLDTIIFDIDGVLIKVAHSFRKACCLTTNYYFKKLLRYKGKVNLLTVADTELFKLAGGFNDDWDLTYAAVIFYLYKSYKYNTQHLDKLLAMPPSLNEYTNRLKELGGGLKAVNRFLKEDNLKLKNLHLFNKATIKQIFMEYYAGEKINEIYGTDRKFVKYKGLYKKEEVLLQEKLPPNMKYGIVTGRTWGETHAALNLLNLDIKREYIVCQDDGIKKPHYQCLNILVNNLQIKAGLYIGDTIDDLNLVTNFNRKNKTIKFLAAIINSKNKQVFINAGCDILAKNINELIKWLKEVL